MKKSILLIGLLALPIIATAEVNEKFAALNDEIEMVRSMADLERRCVITQNLLLTGEESAKFWQIYDEYVIDKKRVKDRLITVITDYAANYEDLTDEQARSMIKDYMKIEDDLLKLRKRYMRKFEQVLTGKHYARFFQIENKLDTVADLTMAQGIPLVLQ